MLPEDIDKEISSVLFDHFIQDINSAEAIQEIRKILEKYSCQNTVSEENKPSRKIPESDIKYFNKFKKKTNNNG